MGTVLISLHDFGQNAMLWLALPIIVLLGDCWHEHAAPAPMYNC